MRFNPYHLLSRRNDLKALLNGRLPQRVVRKFTYRQAFRTARWITKLMGVGR